ncbi:MAG: M12 family metallo-peptidase [Acidimicrobiia bacterium]
MLALLLLPVAWFGVAFPLGDVLEPSALSSYPIYGLECGRRLTEPPGDRVSVVQSVRVLLATDEEWQELHGESGDAKARSLLLGASSMFRGVAIHLLPVRIVEWDSPDDLATVRDLTVAAEETVPRREADIVVVLTAQKRDTFEDGYAQVGGRYVVVASHPGHPDQDVTVLAHELSHLFGAHHGCDVPGYEGLMAPGEFDGASLICPCTRRVLEMNAQRFHTTNS